MKKLLLTAAMLSIGLTSVPAAADGHVSIGADIVSRYVWRGVDFGDGASVQPGISYSSGAFEIGAWSSWGLTSNGANEKDLYLSFGAGPVDITITDYFFPTEGADFLDIGHHTIEVGAGFGAGSLSLFAAMNVAGDAANNDLYLEVGMDMGTVGDAEIGIVVGLGNEVYTSDGDPMLCNIGLNVSQGDFFGSYVINPDTKTPHLFIGKSF